MKKQVKRLLACLTLCALLLGGLSVPAAAAGSFADVPANHWAAPSIRRCVALGFFKGETASRFGVGHPMTRAAFTVVLCRFVGWETAAPVRSAYTDVPVRAWYAGAVQAAREHGAITDQRPEFRPGDAVTREELAVMLIRALGYGAIAGLAQDLPVTFQDVTTNAGYLTMACDLGLMSGVSAEAFAPQRTAPREQVAVILMRLYDKLHAPAPEKIGILSPEELPETLSGYKALAVSGGLLTGTGSVSVPQDKVSAEAQAAIRASGAKALLHVKGSALKDSAAETAAKLAEAVAKGGWDGLLLDIPGLKNPQKQAMTQLTQMLKPALDGKLLYVTAEAPAWQGTVYDGYDYAALSEAADRLILRVASHRGSGSYPAAAVEPLEELYYALAQLQGSVKSGKLSILLTTEPSVWVNGRSSSMAKAGLEALLRSGRLERHYSDRYGCAYLSGTDSVGRALMVWYLDEASLSQRERMAKLFGVTQVTAANAVPFTMPEN